MRAASAVTIPPPSRRPTPHGTAARRPIRAQRAGWRGLPTAPTRATPGLAPRASTIAPAQSPPARPAGPAAATAGSEAPAPLLRRRFLYGTDYLARRSDWRLSA